jgi:hypothetical protein
MFMSFNNLFHIECPPFVLRAAQRRAGANMAFRVHNEPLLKFINSFDSPSLGEGFGCKTTKKKKHRKMQNVSEPSSASPSR